MYCVVRFVCCALCMAYCVVCTVICVLRRVCCALCIVYWVSCTVYCVVCVVYGVLRIA